MKRNIIFSTLLIASCQSNHLLNPNISREIASMHKLDFQKQEITREFLLGPRAQFIILPNQTGVKSVSFKDSDISCEGNNIIKHRRGEKTKFFISTNSYLECASNTLGIKKVSYEFNFLKNEELSNFDYLNIVKNRLDPQEFDEFLSESKLEHSLSKRMDLEDFKKIDLHKGDFIKIRFLPQSVSHTCSEMKTPERVSITGVSKSFNSQKIVDLKQLKFPHLSPFIAFCGGKFSASNIHLNTKHDLVYSGYVDSNGFSCDSNTFLFSKEQPRIMMDVVHVGKEVVTSHKRPSVVQELFREIDHVNTILEKSEIRYGRESKPGFIRVLVNNRNSILDIERAVIIDGEVSSKRNREPSSTSSVNSSVNLCPEEFRSLVKKGMKSLEQYKKKHKHKSCLIYKE